MAAINTRVASRHGQNRGRRAIAHAKPHAFSPSLVRASTDTRVSFRHLEKSTAFLRDGDHRLCLCLQGVDPDPEEFPPKNRDKGVKVDTSLLSCVA